MEGAPRRWKEEARKEKAPVPDAGSASTVGTFLICFFPCSLWRRDSSSIVVHKKTGSSVLPCPAHAQMLKCRRMGSRSSFCCQPVSVLHGAQWSRVAAQLKGDVLQSREAAQCSTPSTECNTPGPCHSPLGMGVLRAGPWVGRASDGGGSRCVFPCFHQKPPPRALPHTPFPRVQGGHQSSPGTPNTDTGGCGGDLSLLSTQGTWDKHLCLCWGWAGLGNPSCA